MSKKYAEFVVDKRIIKRQIDRGLITEAEYKEFVSSLPDDSKNADVCKVCPDEENLLTFSSVESAKH